MHYYINNIPISLIIQGFVFGNTVPFFQTTATASGGGMPSLGSIVPAVFVLNLQISVNFFKNLFKEETSARLPRGHFFSILHTTYYVLHFSKFADAAVIAEFALLSGRGRKLAQTNRTDRGGNFFV